MNIFYYILHRFYNGWRWFYAPSLSRYRRFRIIRESGSLKFWKEKEYHLVDKKKREGK